MWCVARVQPLLATARRGSLLVRKHKGLIVMQLELPDNLMMFGFLCKRCQTPVLKGNIRIAKIRIAENEVASELYCHKCGEWRMVSEFTIARISRGGK